MGETPSTITRAQRWRSPIAFLIVALVVFGYMMSYIDKSFAAPVELIPFGMLAAGYLFGVDYGQLARKKD